jgi:hypothetical protein
MAGIQIFQAAPTIDCPRFSGHDELDIHDFLEHFNHLATVSNYNDQQKLQYLPAFLSHDVVAYMISLPVQQTQHD